MSKSITKHFWLFQIGEPLPLDPSHRKMRTALLAEELASRGHRVLWWASAYDHQKKDWVSPEFRVVPWQERVEIALLKGCGYKKNLSLKRFWDHRLVAGDFCKRARDFGLPDMAVISLPSHDLAYEAVRFCKNNGIPCLVDVRDPWPDIFLEYLPRPLKPFLRAALWYDYKMSSSALRQADVLTSMMDSLLSWGLEKSTRPRGKYDRVFHLGCENAANPEVRAERIKPLAEKLKGRFVVTFIGTFGHYYNPLILAKIARELRERDDIHFLFGGDGIFFPQVRDEVEGLENATLLGWLAQEEIISVLALSSVGVVPATSEEEAFPNKAFVYLSAGIPVLSSCRGELWDLIDSEHIGKNFRAGDARALREMILQLAADAPLTEKLAGNSRRVFGEKFDSAKIYRDFADMLEEILEKRG